jgi:hypothetical protein
MCCAASTAPSFSAGSSWAVYVTLRASRNLVTLFVMAMEFKTLYNYKQKGGSHARI